MNIYARSALSAFLLLSTLTGVPATESAEYYIYRHPDGRLVLSNQKPPPGSKIIKQQSLPDLARVTTHKSKTGMNHSQTARRRI